MRVGSCGASFASMVHQAVCLLAGAVVVFTLENRSGLCLEIPSTSAPVLLMWTPSMVAGNLQETYPDICS